MQTSAAMRQQIEQWEGCRLDAYRDAIGVLTIGYGHTGPDVTEGLSITAEQADGLLMSDLRKFEDGVERLIGVAPTTQGQFDALVSFAFNLGLGALGGSSLLRYHKAGDYPAAADEFGKWNHAGGQVLAGLTRRRDGEAQIYADAS